MGIPEEFKKVIARSWEDSEIILRRDADHRRTMDLVSEGIKEICEPHEDIDEFLGFDVRNALRDAEINPEKMRAFVLALQRRNIVLQRRTT